MDRLRRKLPQRKFVILKHRRAQSCKSQKRHFLSNIDFEKFVPKTRGFLGIDPLEKRIRDYRMHIHNLDLKVNSEIEKYAKIGGGNRNQKKEIGSEAGLEGEEDIVDYSGSIGKPNVYGNRESICSVVVETGFRD